jgi:plastocyanin
MNHARDRVPSLGLAWACGVALAAGSLQGPVRILERDGSVRPGLRDAVALLEPSRPGPWPWPAPSAPLVIRTVGKRFLPRVAIATPGTEVRFPNLDPILHNVFSVTPGDAFDTGHYLPGDAPAVRLANPGLVKLYCNIHHQMNAYVWVVTTPFVQLLGGRRQVRFQEVPPGEYRLRLWHPETGDREWPVRIGPGVTRGQWTLAVSLPRVEPHKNKFGRDYPPPSEDREY